MIPLTVAEPTFLPGSVAVYGLCLLAMAAAMTVEPSSRALRSINSTSSALLDAQA